MNVSIFPAHNTHHGSEEQRSVEPKTFVVEGIDKSICIVIDGKESYFKHDIFKRSDCKIFVAKEAFPHSKMDKWISRKENFENFDFVFTTQKSLISKLGMPNVLYIPFATSWCEKIEWTKEQQVSKKLAISYMPGKKNMAEFEGHAVRKYFYAFLRLNEINNHIGSKVPIDLFHPEIWVKNKEDIFDTYQYSVIVENFSSPGWFTEKLIDPFLRMTIPIYWGDPDIHSIFDKRGMILFKNEKDFSENVRSINSETYYNMYPFLVKNHNIATDLVRKDKSLDNNCFYRRSVELAKTLPL